MTEKENNDQLNVKNSDKTWLQNKYESKWLYDESHPWRFIQHVVLRGIFTGASLSFVGAIPYALVKRRGQVLQSVGKIALRGSLVGGSIMGLVAAERMYHFNEAEVGDRAYRLAYNWGQNKWDFFAMEGAVIGGYFLRRPFGGMFPAAATGIAIGTFIFAGASVANKVLL